MKYFIFCFITLAFVSCIQNQEKKVSEIPKPKTNAIDSLAITDDMLFENFSCNIDTAHYYAKPDSSTKIDKFILKNDHAVICIKQGGFGYAVALTDSGKIPQGWLQLKNFTQIFFTAPKISKE